MLRHFLLTLLLLCLTAPHAHAVDADNSKAVILAYHRVGEPQHPQNNIETALFDAHITEITNGDYNILPLTDIVNAIKTKAPLPPKTIAITFDGNYQSTYDNAIKKLIKQNIPFTLFIAGNTTKLQNRINWKTIKKIAKFKGASFGILPANHEHITNLTANEATRRINASRIAFKKNIGQEATFFAYPYGEISNTLINITKTQGFTAAFGLHSGPAHTSLNPLRLPRFSMTTQYADIDRLRMITNTLPLPAKEIEPQNWEIISPLNQIGFTVPAALEGNLANLSCHISGQSKPTIETLGNRVEIIPSEPITDERTRLNCTLAHGENNDSNHDNNNEKQWRWLGMLFHTPPN